MVHNLQLRLGTDNPTVFLVESWNQSFWVTMFSQGCYRFSKSFSTFSGLLCRPAPKPLRRHCDLVPQIEPFSRSLGSCLFFVQTTGLSFAPLMLHACAMDHPPAFT